MSEAEAPKPAKEKAPEAKKGQGRKAAAAAAEAEKLANAKEARDPNYVPRFKKRYYDVVRPQLMEKFGYKNALQAPRIEKIVLNIGAGEGAEIGRAHV